MAPGGRPRSWRPLLDDTVLLGVGIMLVWLVVGLLSASPEQRLALARWNFQMMFDGEGLQWGWYLLFTLVGVVMEELLFRVLLQRAFEGYMSQRAALLSQAGLFFLTHMYLYGYGFSVFHAYIGVLFGLVFMKTRSLMAPVLVHVLCNVTFAALTTRGLAS